MAPLPNSPAKLLVFDFMFSRISGSSCSYAFLHSITYLFGELPTPTSDVMLPGPSQ